MALFETDLRPYGSDRALFLVDEPEAALSPSRQLEFLKLLHRWNRAGRAQAIVATHPPIVMSYPEAALLRVSREEIRMVDYRETEHYRITRGFLANPEKVMSDLFADD